MPANPNYSEILTTTIESRSRVLADNVTKNNALLNRLNQRGNVRTVSGGVTILQELEYAENATFTRYSGFDALSIAQSDVFSSAEYAWKQAAVAVVISGLEGDVQNAGPEAFINLLTSRLGNAERTMMNNLSLDAYSDGTADSGKQMGGLQLLVADSPASGTVGGIDRASNAFWQNYADATATTSSNIQSLMNTAFLATARGADQVDLIVADNNSYTDYWESLQAIQRITQANEGQAGFATLRYMGADVIYDGGIGGGAPTNQMYFLNTDFIFDRPHVSRNMVPLNPERFATDQDAMVRLIGWAGNMTMSNASLQGVLTG